jgi:hypothetical protein
VPGRSTCSMSLVRVTFAPNSRDSCPLHSQDNRPALRIELLHVPGPGHVRPESGRHHRRRTRRSTAPSRTMRAPSPPRPGRGLW